MNEYIFLFGFGHEVDGIGVANNFVRVFAPDARLAEEAMIQEFGEDVQWSRRFDPPNAYEKARIKEFRLKHFANVTWRAK